MYYTKTSSSTRKLGRAASSSLTTMAFCSSSSSPFPLSYSRPVNSRSLVAFRGPHLLRFFCSAGTSNEWGDLLRVRRQHGLSHDDELLATFRESRPHQSSYSMRQLADSTRCHGVDPLPQRAFSRPTMRFPEACQPRAVIGADNSLWSKEAVEVKNSKKNLQHGMAELESSTYNKLQQNSSQNTTNGNAEGSGYHGISPGFGSPKISTTSLDLEAYYSQVKEQRHEDLHPVVQLVEERNHNIGSNKTLTASTMKEVSSDANGKAPSLNGAQLGKEFNGHLLSRGRSGVKEMSAVAHGIEEAEMVLPANGLHPVEELDEKLLFQEEYDENEKYVVTDSKRFLQEAQIINESKLRTKLCSIFDKVLVVDNLTLARKVVRKLTNEYRHHVHACDTEVSKIDVKQETPVDHGEIICFSIYSGKEADYGNGKSCIWVDVLEGGGKDILAEFAPFFENPSIKKVWHNYSFDCHVVQNYGIKLSGFHADTMHMARLWDSSRRIDGGYSLEALTRDPKVMCETSMDQDEDMIGKISMKTIFGRRKIKKDGSMGKIVTLPAVEELQREERQPWICYSALDSMSTLKLYESLKCKLSKMPWRMNGKSIGNMLDFYESYWQPFGKLLVKMETLGMLVDRAYLSEVEKVAIVEQQIAADRFRNWASKYCPDARFMNVGSDTQLRQLFFGGICNRKNQSEYLPTEKKFKIANVDNVIEEGKKTARKFRDITLHKIGSQIHTDLYTPSGWPSISGDALKAIAGKVSAEYDFSDDTSESELEVTDDPQQSSTEEVDISAYGTAYAAFDGGKEGMEACHAIAALCEMCSIDSLISNFILPLQGSHISGKNGRIHCSLNINTETGRLSARRPNLQNQPALEKDRYKIRKAFVAAPGNSLIVADYGQLELRILAHLADCRSMKEAFIAGGDFHSRTAMNMYPYIREAVERKEVLLEWHPQPGEEKPPVPLLKDAFGSERRKAKMLNFSIAYGKTPMGLAKDWKVSVKEAKETVDLWYRERQEVLRWQMARKKEAVKFGCVHTLLGRARRFPSVDQSTSPQRGHIERAAINTPVQGSAADVAMCAMLEIDSNMRLKELGWKLLLQVHDEVILEGPSESADEAKALVVECMSKPFNGRNLLTVELAVDAKCAQNWYAAK